MSPEIFDFEKPNPFGNWQPLAIPRDITRTGVYVGTSGYYFDDWLGKFNPPRISKKDYNLLQEEQKKDHDRFQFYQKYFSFIEINHTFYQEPQLRAFIDIEKRSRSRTLISVKVHKDISHPKTPDIHKGIEQMQRHVHAVSPLAESGRFYSFLIQLGDYNDRSLEKLDYLLAISEVAIKKRMDVHIEFRHKSWHNQHVLKKMKDCGVGICNTEIPMFEHTYPLKTYATTDKGYIRYSGRNKRAWYPKAKAETSKERTEQRNRRYDYLYTKKEVADRVKAQVQLLKKANTLAIAYNNHYNIQAIKNALENINFYCPSKPSEK